MIPQNQKGISVAYVIKYVKETQNTKSEYCLLKCSFYVYNLKLEYKRIHVHILYEMIN